MRVRMCGTDYRAASELVDEYRGADARVRFGSISHVRAPSSGFSEPSVFVFRFSDMSCHCRLDLPLKVINGNREPMDAGVRRISPRRLPRFRFTFQIVNGAPAAEVVYGDSIRLGMFAGPCAKP